MNFKDLASRAFKKRRLIDYIFYTGVIALGIVIDQVTKLLASTFLRSTVTTPLIEGVLHLTYVENRGAAFGMLKDAPWVFNSFSVIAITAMLLYLYLGHASNKLYEISIAMIISGGIGNMIDRVALGYVVDFIDFRLINFAVFNGADSFVCVGAGLVILALILEIVKESKEEKARRAAEEAGSTQRAHEEDEE
ncbi:MAG: signal peptidase II [Clostridia bacterium]|nr:signal peptidase II [Clostridia bacterium]